MMFKGERVLIKESLREKNDEGWKGKWKGRELQRKGKGTLKERVKLVDIETNMGKGKE